MDITKVNVNGVEANLGGSSGGVEIFNCAEVEPSGGVQQILDAYNSGKKLVFIFSYVDGSSGSMTESIVDALGIRVAKNGAGAAQTVTVWYYDYQAGNSSPAFEYITYFN